MISGDDDHNYNYRDDVRDVRDHSHNGRGDVRDDGRDHSHNGHRGDGGH